MIKIQLIFIQWLIFLNHQEKIYLKHATFRMIWGKFKIFRMCVFHINSKFCEFPWSPHQILIKILLCDTHHRKSENRIFTDTIVQELWLVEICLDLCQVYDLPKSTLHNLHPDNRCSYRIIHQDFWLQFYFYSYRSLQMRQNGYFMFFFVSTMFLHKQI